VERKLEEYKDIDMQYGGSREDKLLQVGFALLCVLIGGEDALNQLQVGSCCGFKTGEAFLL
jgi:hypothetical protein